MNVNRVLSAKISNNVTFVRFKTSWNKVTYWTEMFASANSKSHTIFIFRDILMLLSLV